MNTKPEIILVKFPYPTFKAIFETNFGEESKYLCVMTNRFFTYKQFEEYVADCKYVFLYKYEWVWDERDCFYMLWVRYATIQTFENSREFINFKRFEHEETTK